MRGAHDGIWEILHSRGTFSTRRANRTLHSTSWQNPTRTSRSGNHLVPGREHQFYMWHNQETNAKGEKLESFILQHRLTIANSPQRIPTFDDTRGNWNIDITLCTKTAAKELRNWKVHPNQTTSDHNLITFEVTKGTQETTLKRNNRFNTKRADWAAYGVT